jgi:hypothetical protein
MPAPTPPTSKRSKTTSIVVVNEAITNPKRAMNNSSEDEFQQFANHIEAQLRQLLLQNALRLQENIRSFITRERISCMTLPSPLHVQIPQDVISLSPSTSSSDQSNIENRDILQEAIISINSEDFI